MGEISRQMSSHLDERVSRLTKDVDSISHCWSMLSCVSGWVGLRPEPSYSCLSGYRRLDNNALPHCMEVYEDDECVLDIGYTGNISTCFQNCSSIGSCTGFALGYTVESKNYFICILFSCTNLTYYLYRDYDDEGSFYSYFKDENYTVDIDYQCYPVYGGGDQTQLSLRM